MQKKSVLWGSLLRGGLPLILFMIIGLSWNSPVFGVVSIGVEVPFGFSYSDPSIKVDNSSGFGVSYQLPILLGFGVENIINKISDTDDTIINYTLINVFYNVPVSIIDITYGVGFGIVSVDCSGCDDVFKEGPAFQGFSKAGYTFDVGFDLRLAFGIHYINAHNEMISNDTTTLNTITTSDTSNYHYSLLVAVGS